jgi:hypothetical protein
MLPGDEGDLDLVADYDLLESIRPQVIEIVHSQMIGECCLFNPLEVPVSIRDEDEALMD